MLTKLFVCGPVFFGTIMKDGNPSVAKSRRLREATDLIASEISYEEASRPTKANPGTEYKMAILRARLLYNLPLFIEDVQPLNKELPDD
jgi:hypothetical protein